MKLFGFLLAMLVTSNAHAGQLLRAECQPTSGNNHFTAYLPTGNAHGQYGFASYGDELTQLAGTSDAFFEGGHTRVTGALNVALKVATTQFEQAEPFSLEAHFLIFGVKDFDGLPESFLHGQGFGETKNAAGEVMDSFTFSCKVSLAD